MHTRWDLIIFTPTFRVIMSIINIIVKNHIMVGFRFVNDVLAMMMLRVMQKNRKQRVKIRKTVTGNSTIIINIDPMRLALIALHKN